MDIALYDTCIILRALVSDHAYSYDKQIDHNTDKTAKTIKFIFVEY